MNELRVGKIKRFRLIRTRALWACLLPGLLAVAILSRSGIRTIFAQSSEPQAGTPQSAPITPDGASPQAATPEQGAKSPAPVSPTDQKKKQIADDTSNLLKLANQLKAEVDKTSQDTMSVPVIRQAEEIEKLAHRMRTK